MASNLDINLEAPASFVLLQDHNISQIRTTLVTFTVECVGLTPESWYQPWSAGHRTALSLSF